MVVRQMTGIYFSPTGHTKRAVETVLGQFGGHAEEVDLTPALRRPSYGFTENEAVAVGVPVYAGRVPETAVERLRLLRGSRTPALVLVTYGNRAFDDALLELCDVLRAQGFLPFAAAAVPGEHNIVPKIAAGRPDAEDIKKLEAFGKKAAGALRGFLSGAAIGELPVPGNRPYRPYQAMHLKFSVSSKCTDCGACIRACPVQAISRTDPGIMDEERCISCMRCTVVCPLAGRKVSTLMMLAVGQKLKKVCAGRKEQETFFAAGC